MRLKLKTKNGWIDAQECATLDAAAGEWRVSYRTLIQGRVCECRCTWPAKAMADDPIAGRTELRERGGIGLAQNLTMLRADASEAAAPADVLQPAAWQV